MQESVSNGVHTDKVTSNRTKRRFDFCKTFSEEHQEWPRRSLIDDARKDSAVNQSFEVSELDENEDEIKTTNLVIKLSHGTGITEVLNQLKDIPYDLLHLEPRKSCFGDSGIYKSKIDLLFVFKSTKKVSDLIMTKIESIAGCESVIVVEDDRSKTDNKDIWFPTHISDLDSCQHLVLKFQPELATDHPGFHDKIYRKRRHEIASQAFEHRYGHPIEDVEYSEEELATWKTVYVTLKKMCTTMACQEHMKGLELLEKAGIYSPDRIPSMEAVSNFLKKASGFRLRPVAGLLSARDFLASLAFRVFQCTQYVRHPSKPLHSVEPDCIHELLGHVPMLTNPDFAEFSQMIGLASIGVSDAEIEKLATVYWFTVEFGICTEGDNVKAYGAGLLSSYGELQHALSDVPQRKKFDPYVTSLTKYTDEDYQPLYYVTDSINNMKESMREYTKSMERPFEVSYNPYTESIEILHDHRAVEKVLHRIDNELHLIRKIVTKISNL